MPWPPAGAPAGPGRGSWQAPVPRREGLVRHGFEALGVQGEEAVAPDVAARRNSATFPGLKR